MVTIPGAARFTGPVRSWSIAQRMAPTSSAMWIQGNHCLPLPIGPPTPGGYRSEPLHFYGMAAGDAVLGGGRGGAAFPVSDDYVVMALQASAVVE